MIYSYVNLYASGKIIKIKINLLETDLAMYVTNNSRTCSPSLESVNLVSPSIVLIRPAKKRGAPSGREKEGKECE